MMALYHTDCLGSTSCIVMLHWFFETQCCILLLSVYLSILVKNKSEVLAKET